MQRSYKVLKFNCKWEQIPAEQNPYYLRQALKMVDEEKEHQVPPLCLLVCSEGEVDFNGATVEAFSVLDISENFITILYLGVFYDFLVACSFADFWAEKRNKALNPLHADIDKAYIVPGSMPNSSIALQIEPETKELQVISSSFKEQTNVFLTRFDACKLVNYISTLIELEARDVDIPVRPNPLRSASEIN